MPRKLMIQFEGRYFIILSLSLISTWNM